MYICTNKTARYKKNEFSDISFQCSNCFNKQLIKDYYYIYIGYCENSVHHSCYNKGFNNLDEISFVCSYKSCGKISFNTLDGKPKYTPVSLSKKENEILSLLISKKQEILKNLLQEYFYALTLKHNSSATLLARKILIHFACELGCTYKKAEKITYYVDYIKNDGVLGKKWNEKLDLIRTLGNDESHQLKIATDNELQNIKLIMEHFINCYFLPELN